jgi:hypothetical protein
MKKSLKMLISSLICLSIMTCTYFASFPLAVTRSNDYMNTELLPAYSRLHVHYSYTVESMRGVMDVFSSDGWDLIVHSYDKTSYRCRNLYITDYPDSGHQNMFGSYKGYIEGSQVGYWTLS